VVLPCEGPLAGDLRDADIRVIVRDVAMLAGELATPRGLTTALGTAARDAPAMKALIARLGVSLVHSNASIVLGGAAAAAAAGVPHVWHVREIHWRLGELWPRYEQLLGNARVLACVSRAAADQFRAEDRVRVIPDGLAVDRSRLSRARARELLGLPQDAPTIALVGRIAEAKGQDVLIRALAHPALRERGAGGVIAGDTLPGTGERRAAALRLAAELEVEDRLRLLGFRADVAAVYGAADMIVVPSTEPAALPAAAIEAGAAGRPVIASALGGLPEIVRAGETGRLVRPRDASALACAAAELLDDPAECARLGEAAAHEVRRRFRPERLLEAIQDLYDEILD
jgi:glycosyltransferase involved in cell wall biosynthesis